MWKQSEDASGPCPAASLAAQGIACFCEVSLPMIRKANSSDARKLSQLAEATFREAFAAMNTAENVDHHCRTSYSEPIQAAELSRADMVTLLSESEGSVSGFAQLRWKGAPVAVQAESPGEIQRFYVVAGWHGKGVARNLMDACIEEMRGRGSDVAWLGVWEHNPRAIAFYKKCGFAEVGEHTFLLGNDPQRDIVMARPVLDF